MVKRSLQPFARAGPSVNHSCNDLGSSPVCRCTSSESAVIRAMIAAVAAVWHLVTICCGLQATYPDGLFAFYFGRTDRKEQALYTRSNEHHHEPDTEATAKVDQLIKTLRNRDVPVVHMCSQISVEQGRGSLETIMLHHFDFIANDADNDRARWYAATMDGHASQRYRVNWKDKDALFEAFKNECASAKACGLLSVQHADFFATATGSGATALNKYLVQSRAVFVKLQDAYRAADQLKIMPDPLSEERTELKLILADALKGLADAEERVDKCMDDVMQHKVCYEYCHFEDKTSSFGKTARSIAMAEARNTRKQQEGASETRWQTALGCSSPRSCLNAKMLKASGKELPVEELSATKGSSKMRGTPDMKPAKASPGASLLAKLLPHLRATERQLAIFQNKIETARMHGLASKHGHYPVEGYLIQLWPGEPQCKIQVAQQLLRQHGFLPCDLWTGKPCNSFEEYVQVISSVIVKLAAK